MCLKSGILFILFVFCLIFSLSNRFWRSSYACTLVSHLVFFFKWIQKIPSYSKPLFI